MDLRLAAYKLSDVAKAAQKAPADLKDFRPHVSPDEAEFHNMVKRCFSISSLLESISRLLFAISSLGAHALVSRWQEYREDVSNVMYSVEYTFKDLHEWVAKGLEISDKEGLGKWKALKETWMNVHTRFIEESGYPLSERLELYEEYLTGLEEVFGDG